MQFILIFLISSEISLIFLHLILRQCFAKSHLASLVNQIIATVSTYRFVTGLSKLFPCQACSPSKFVCLPQSFLLALLRLVNQVKCVIFSAQSDQMCVLQSIVLNDLSRGQCDLSHTIRLLQYLPLYLQPKRRAGRWGIGWNDDAGTKVGVGGGDEVDIDGVGK